jgi:soluble lytic murein transglycosylase-like protein
VLVAWLFLSISITASDKGTYLSEEIQQACIKYGEEYGICPELLMAIIEKESSGRADVVSDMGCVGLMQINPKYQTERMERLGVADLTDIDGNVLVGTDYLMELATEYGDLYLVLMCYNMGASRAIELYEQEEYSNYAVSITERSVELEMLHGK